MMNNRFLQGLLGFAAVILASTVSALPITGEIEFAGVFAADSSEESVTGLQQVRVTHATGDFASLVAVGDLVDLSGIDLLQQPSWSVNDLSFTLLTAALADTSNDSPLDFTGDGNVDFAGTTLDPNAFIWSFSETEFLPTISLFEMRIEARESTVVSEPSILALMLLGVVGLIIGRRRS